MKKSSAWQLVYPYWTSAEKYSAWTMLLFTVVVGQGFVGLSVWTNDWQGCLFDALNDHNQGQFYTLLGVFIPLMFGTIAVTLLNSLMGAVVAFRWRRWLVLRMSRDWLGRGTFYKIERQHLVDNPDQRICEDAEKLVTLTLKLSMNLLTAVTSVLSFGVVLWNLSGSLTLEAGGALWVIPGFMFWMALLYSALGSLLTHLVGKRLISINFRREKVEADYRFQMMRVRENAAQVAMYKGGATEEARLAGAYESIRIIWWEHLRVSLRMNIVVISYSELSSVIARLAAAPGYFAGDISLGDINRISGAFTAMQMSLSWFVLSYSDLVEWRAVVNRLNGFFDAVHADEEGDLRLRLSDGIQLNTCDLSLHLPDGSELGSPGPLCISPGERWLLQGPSGTGKSTLLKALAGLWPHGTGEVHLPSNGRLMFLPQQSYLPEGSLKSVLCYPSDEIAFTDQACIEVLDICQMRKFADQLHQERPWHQQLSPGEQQRIAFGRALLQRPDFLFLDESTSALDNATEAHLYQAIIRDLPQTAIVSIAHRDSVFRYHEYHLQMVG